MNHISKIFILLIISLSILSIFGQNDHPRVFEYYSEGGIQTGLTADQNGFRLNGKDIRIYSGSLHYFRVHPAYWRDRMRRFRAAGLIAIDTYVPWNLHEPTKGQFDFGQGSNEMSTFLDLVTFIKMAQEEDLLVIFRPGPYICSEWEFGGLPSWLLSDPETVVRQSNLNYEERVQIYFDQLLPLVRDLQWSNGGPIIAVQIENEYGAFIRSVRDDAHLEFLKRSLEGAGIVELLFTSDSPAISYDWGALPGVLQTANFQDGAGRQLDKLLELQPGRPIFVAEFWSGWYDHWLEDHNVISAEDMGRELETILGTYNGSVNFYMFFGGTNFGFLAGANNVPYFVDLPYYAPHVTSYDYNAPISENGNYDPKYFKAIEVMDSHAEVSFWRPQRPPHIPTMAYPEIVLELFLSWEDIVLQIPEESRFAYADVQNPPSMENLPMNGGSGQSYGYIIYRVGPLEVNNATTITIGRSRDLTTIVVDEMTQNPPLRSHLDLVAGFGYWTRPSQSFTLEEVAVPGSRRVDLVVENMGRVNFGGPGSFNIHKGLQEGTISINGVHISEMEVLALEFKSDWVKGLEGFKTVTEENSLRGPILFMGAFLIDGEPKDTFLDMTQWTKGIVFVNGFNLGRYFSAGPQQHLYVPAPLLTRGINTIHVFEMFQGSDRIVFSDRHNLAG